MKTNTIKKKGFIFVPLMAVASITTGCNSAASSIQSQLRTQRNKGPKSTSSIMKPAPKYRTKTDKRNRNQKRNPRELDSHKRWEKQFYLLHPEFSSQSDPKSRRPTTHQKSVYKLSNYGGIALVPRRINQKSSILSPPERWLQFHTSIHKEWKMFYEPINQNRLYADRIDWVEFNQFKIEQEIMTKLRPKKQPSSPISSSIQCSKSNDVKSRKKTTSFDHIQGAFHITQPYLAKTSVDNTNNQQ